MYEFKAIIYRLSGFFALFQIYKKAAGTDFIIRTGSLCLLAKVIPLYYGRVITLSANAFHLSCLIRFLVRDSIAAAALTKATPIMNGTLCV